MLMRNRPAVHKRSLLVALLFTMSLASVGVGRSATTWTAGGFRAYAKFRHCTLNPAYKVFLYSRTSVTATTGSIPVASTGHYKISLETLAPGSTTACVTVDIEDRPSSDAKIFNVSPDMSSAELLAPSSLGTVHVVWSSAAIPAPGTATDPPLSTSPLAAGGSAYLERLASAQGSIGTVITPRTAVSATIRLGLWSALAG